MKKVLFTASINKHLIRFHEPYLEWFKNYGFETHTGASGDDVINYTDQQHQISFIRNPFSLGNIKAYKQLRKLFSKIDFEVIHCHTPSASILTRLAARSQRKKGTKVIYTAHGFHFFKGAPFHFWLLYFPIEIMMSYFTDIIITINNEDYDVIRRFGSKNTKYFKVPGVGVNSSRFNSITLADKNDIRKRNGFSAMDFILVYAAEFIPRKNHEFIINTVSSLLRKIPNLKILFAGRGKDQSKLEELVSQKKLSDTIHFLGFRTDIDKIFKMSDVGISTSNQEGLGLNLIEEMMCGLPVVATNVRGHNEIVDNGVNGYLFEKNDTTGFVNAIFRIYNNSNLTTLMKSKSIEKANRFELENSNIEMDRIYKQAINT